MTLDLTKVVVQIRQMGGAMATSIGERSARRERANALLHSESDRYSELSAKAFEARPRWSLALPEEPLNAVHRAAMSPSDYVVMATDGSAIEPDHHQGISCYLLNIGEAVLQYGSSTRALLTSEPTLCYKEEDLYLRVRGRRWLVQEHLLAAKLSVEEMGKLADLIESAPVGVPTLALRDGPLTLLSLEGLGEEAAREKYLPQFIEMLERLRAHAIPVAGFVSLPRASYVVNLLAAGTCPYPNAKCQQRCPAGSDCPDLMGLTDIEVFLSILPSPGQRSGVFRRPPPDPKQSYGANQPLFFYMNAGPVADPEVVRVEVPEWVAQDSTQLGLVHALVYDQCCRGGGYPPVLLEAHEKAVVTAGDRQLFYSAVEEVLSDHHASLTVSRKEASKRRRPV